MKNSILVERECIKTRPITGIIIINNIIFIIKREYIEHYILSNRYFERPASVTVGIRKRSGFKNVQCKL